MNVEVKEIEAMPIVAVRHVGPYAGDADLFGRLFGQVCGWAGPKGLMGADTKYLSIYYDTPETAAPEDQRLDVALSVQEGTEGEGEIEAKTLEGGQFAVGTFEIEKPEDYMAAWKSVWGWVSQSEFEVEMEGRAGYELYEGEQKEGANRTVHIHLPVKARV